MQTPRSPSSSGSLASIAAAASRSTLKVPIRFTRMTASNGSNECGPRLPAVFSAQPMPAQQTEIRSVPAASTAAATCAASVTSHSTKRALELLGQRRALLGVEVGDGDLRARGAQAAGGRGAEPGGPAGHQRAGSLDSHDARP